MKKLRFLPVAAIIAATVFLSSCSYNPNSMPPGSTATLNFQKNFHANYDTFVVDTTDKILSSTKITASEIVVETGITYPDTGKNTKTNVAKIVTSYNDSLKTKDTNYFYQDPNGDLYRYNFGFSILNQFTYLTQAIGSNVDVGWVLAAKMASAEGATWVAKNDSVFVLSLNVWAFLSSQGQMMADTTFHIDTATVKARHARNIVTATAGGGAEHGTIIIDSYYSTDINAVIEDFFRHVALSGPLLNQQVQGKFKIMTSHIP